MSVPVMRHICRDGAGAGGLRVLGEYSLICCSLPGMEIGLTNAALGVAAEHSACLALAADGWEILGRRVRTKAGEIDAIAEKAGLLAFVEVKARPTLAMAAAALGTKQQARLMKAAEIVMGEHPDWGKAGIRFDVMLVDGQSRVRRVIDAFRLH